MTCGSGSKTGVDGALRSGVTIDQATIPFAASLQMLAQGETGGLDIMPLDGLIDAAVLHLDLLQIVPPLLRRFVARSHQLARNDDGSEEMHEAFEIGVAGGGRDRPVEGEIRLAGALARRDRGVDGIEAVALSG